MSLQNFIPVVWSGRLLANINKSHVWGLTSKTRKTYAKEISIGNCQFSVR